MGTSGFSWKLPEHPKLPKGKTVAVVVLDGWGEAKPDQYNCIHVAETPTMDSLKQVLLYFHLPSDPWLNDFLDAFAASWFCLNMRSMWFSSPLLPVCFPSIVFLVMLEFLILRLKIFFLLDFYVYSYVFTDWFSASSFFCICYICIWSQDSSHQLLTKKSVFYYLVRVLLRSGGWLGLMVRP